MASLLLALGLALSAAVAGITDGELSAALRGEAPAHVEPYPRATGKSAGRGVGAIVVERPIAAVWATVSHYDDKAEYTPRLEAVTVLERRPGLLKVKMQIDASITTVRYTGWFHLDEATHTIHWTLDRGAPDNGIADVDGEYRLFEVAPARTLVVYRTYVDSGRSVPRFIQDHMALRSIPDLLRALKRRVESGGTYHK